MALNVMIESIVTDRMPGPNTIVYGHFQADDEEEPYRFCLEHDIQGWDFDEQTELPEGWSLPELKHLVWERVGIVLEAMDGRK